VDDSNVFGRNGTGPTDLETVLRAQLRKRVLLSWLRPAPAAGLVWLWRRL
jgi:hypothetical protein